MSLGIVGFTLSFPKILVKENTVVVVVVSDLIFCLT